MTLTHVFIFIICVVWFICYVYGETVKANSIEKEREEWRKERQQLLDRIQAPSFDHLKAAEVRVIKAQKEEKPIERVELL